MTTRLIGWIATVAPFLAVAPTAWLIGARTAQHLRWPWPVAVVAAVAVELLGIAVTVTALDAYAWNRAKRKNDPAANVVLPVVLCAVYFAGAEALTVLADIVPGAARYLPALFPVLGLAGMATLAIRYDQARRVAEVADGKAEAKAERRQRKAESATLKSACVAELPQLATQAEPLPEWRPTSWQAFMAHHPDMADMTGRRIAELAGVSDRTGRNWKAAATAIVNGNGNGKGENHA